MRAGRWDGVGRRRREQRAEGTQLPRLLAEARAERTLSISSMLVTLVVSKLSSWLNADVHCRVKEKLRKRDDNAGREAGGRGAAGPAQAACWQDPTVEASGRGAREAHRKHVLHSCDAGRVEAQRLVERRRALPSRKGSIGRGATCRPGGGRVWGWRRRKQRVQGGPNCGGCWQGTRGAHQKHLQHACDAGRVEAQRLVEHRRGLPSRKGSVGTGATCGLGGGRVWGGGSGVSIVLAGPNCCRLLAGARAERTSSMYPMFATLDVSKLSGWLNAFALCRVEREA